MITVTEILAGRDIEGLLTSFVSEDCKNQIRSISSRKLFLQVKMQSLKLCVFGKALTKEQ